jgi:glycosyltransferase involved in cell wall biosynthesis
VRCALGRRHLPGFVGAVDIVAAVSEFNARELEAAGALAPRVIPILFDRDRLGPPGPAQRSGPPTVLFVGRLTPHKRQDEVIRAFALYRRHRAPDARLVLVGEPLNRRYGQNLTDLADQLAPGAVTIESGLSADALAERYREAHAFLCLSEHEGFCIPLLEAFHFGVPVVARPVGGIPEVAGDAALLVDDADLAVVAELVHLAVTDAELRAELAQRAQRRLEVYAAEPTAARLREALEALA